MPNAPGIERSVVWLARQVDAQLLAGLASSGWTIQVCGLDGPVEDSLDHSSAVIGLIDVDSAHLKPVQALIAAYPDKRWIAAASAQALAQDGLTALIRDACFDCITTPATVERVVAALDNAARRPRPNRPQIEIGNVAQCLAGVGGESPPMRTLTACIRKFAPIKLPVLITGETGSGKELVARALHAHSLRHAQPLVTIDCGALTPNLVQSELFGHERGAFTGANARKIGRIEGADHGTVFLDEIGDLPLDAQTNLLRFLQEGTIERLGRCEPIRLSVRVLAATHVDLEKAVGEGRFREDLYYRLNVLRLPVPPLRERGADILNLAQHFLDVFRREYAADLAARGFTRDAQAALRAFSWPGNVRELMNRVRRAAVVAESSMICAADLGLAAVGSGGSGRPVANGLGGARASAERGAIVDCLCASGFNVSECARRLGVARVTVYRLCKKHGIALDVSGEHDLAAH